MPITPVSAKYGRADTVQHRVSSSIRTPVFVDNAVLYAEYKVETDTINGITSSISPPINDDYQFVHDRTYKLIETQDGIRLSHPHRPGMRYDGKIMFNGERLDSVNDTRPMLVIGTDEILNRLIVGNILESDYGTTLPLPNMKTRKLKDIEFEEPLVRLGQTLSVGFRTTDAVQKLMTKSYHSLNSFDIGYTFTGPRTGNHTTYSGADIGKHSRRFVAIDLYGVPIIEAIQHYGRFDNHALYMDRFGNLLYAPTVFAITSRLLGDSQGVGQIKNKPLLPNANRVLVEGRSRALNDLNITAVDDMELQKRMGSIRTTTIFNPLSKSPIQSRRSAAETLRGIKKVQRVVESKDHVNSWDLEPGDVVKYEAPSSGVVKYMALLEATHSTRTHSSDFVMMHNEAGLESIISMAESPGSLSYGTEDDKAFLEPIIEMSNTATINFNITPFVSTYIIGATQPRLHSIGGFLKPNDNAGVNRHSGMIIGHRTLSVNDTARGAIGVGASRRGTVASGVGLFTNELELTEGITGYFPNSGQLLIEDLAGQSKIINYTGKAGAPFTTFTGCTPVGAITPGSTVIYGRPRSHETRMCRARRQVVL